MVQNDFIETFGNYGANIDCSCYYRGNYAYDFTLNLKEIKQLSPDKFAFRGDIINIDDEALPLSLKKRIIPKITTNIELEFIATAKTLSFSSGITIYPYDNDKDVWRKLLGVISKYLIIAQ